MTKKINTRTPDQIADALMSASRSVGGSTSELSIQLTVLCSATVMLGAGPDLLNASLDKFATDQNVDDLSTCWDGIVQAGPFLADHIDRLTGWMRRSNTTNEWKVAAKCFAALRDIDFYGSANDPHLGGDILGPVYMGLRSKVDKQSSGAFYTPMHLSMLMAAMAPLSEGESFYEPSCGAGGMAIATAKVMRRNGHDPATCSWVLNDIDPLAVVLAGINAMVHGMGPNVHLTCSNALTDPVTIPSHP